MVKKRQLTANRVANWTKRTYNVSVSNAHLGSASHRNANHSRRLKVSRGGSGRARRSALLRRFRRTRETINHSLRLIEASGRVIDAAERFAARRPTRAARRYQRVAGWLDQASVDLSSAIRALTVTALKMARSPAQTADARPLLLGATARWYGAAAKLSALTNRLDDTFDLIAEAVETGTTLDFSSLFRNPIVPARRVIRLRPRPRRCLSCSTARIRVLDSRRRRSARLTLPDGERRIFRGRAPPLSSTCPL
jgi:hypothetical protein